MKHRTLQSYPQNNSRTKKLLTALRINQHNKAMVIEEMTKVASASIITNEIDNNKNNSNSRHTSRLENLKLGKVILMTTRNCEIAILATFRMEAAVGAEEIIVEEVIRVDKGRI